jgi:hypothetical protein
MVGHKKIDQSLTPLEQIKTPQEQIDLRKMILLKRNTGLKQNRTDDSFKKIISK